MTLLSGLFVKRRREIQGISARLIDLAVRRNSSFPWLNVSYHGALVAGPPWR